MCVEYKDDYGHTCTSWTHNTCIYSFVYIFTIAKPSSTSFLDSTLSPIQLILKITARLFSAKTLCICYALSQKIVIVPLFLQNYAIYPYRVFKALSNMFPILLWSSPSTPPNLLLHPHQSTHYSHTKQIYLYYQASALIISLACNICFPEQMYLSRIIHVWGYTIFTPLWRYLFFFLKNISHLLNKTIYI